jgi:hypothetical protein
MIPLAAAAWFLWMPIWGVHDPVDWYEQRFEIITEEPGLEDIERELERKKYRIMEASPDANR